MGATQTKFAENDYEMVIKSSKEMERYLETQFGATGQGLHEKLTSVRDSGIPASVIKKARYIATLRNRLIHDADMDCLSDRKTYIETYEAAMIGFHQYVKSCGGYSSSTGGGGDESSSCCIS